MATLEWKDAGVWAKGDRCVPVFNHIGVSNNPPKDMILIVASVDEGICEKRGYETIALTFVNWDGPSTGCGYWNALAFKKITMPSVAKYILDAIAGPDQCRKSDGVS